MDVGETVVWGFGEMISITLLQRNRAVALEQRNCFIRAVVLGFAEDYKTNTS